ncbi:MAG: hypothetical protein JXJ17_07565 [Anaerolineae bacterium]|nr:hypothetical protein [Anaerolineae bacterium]
MDRTELPVEFDRDGLRFEVYYQALPPGVLPQLARMHRGIVTENRTVFESAENRALVIADLDEHVIHITVIGNKSTRRDLLSEIRSNLAAIHADLPGIAFSEEIPLPDFPGISVRYRELVEHEQRGLDFIRLSGVKMNFPVKELLDSIEAPGNRKRESE